MNALAALPLDNNVAFQAIQTAFIFCQGSISGYFFSVKDELVDGAIDTISSWTNSFPCVHFDSGTGDN